MNSFASRGLAPRAWREPPDTTGTNVRILRAAGSNSDVGIRLPGKGVVSKGFTSCLPGSSAEKSPATSACVGGKAVVAAAWRRSLMPSKVPNRTALSRFSGPPAAAPYWFWIRAGFDDWKKLRALSFALRWNSQAAPWNWFVPALLTTVMLAPGLRPLSAAKLLVWILNSWMASGGGAFNPVFREGLLK